MAEAQIRVPAVLEGGTNKTLYHAADRVVEAVRLQKRFASPGQTKYLK